MTAGDHDIANNLKLPDNVKQNIDEIMKTINQSINNFTETENATSDDEEEINNNETQDIYVEVNYLNEEIDFAEPTDNVEMTNVNDYWQRTERC